MISLVIYIVIGVLVGIAAARALAKYDEIGADDPMGVVMLGMTALICGAIWPFSLIVLVLGRLVVKEPRG